MSGWKELARLTERAWQRLTPQQRQGAYIFCDNYGTAGAINYYRKHTLPDALADHSDYRDWRPDPDRPVTVLIRVHGPRNVEWEKELFGIGEPVGTLTRPYAREQGTAVTIFRQPKRPVLVRELYRSR